MRFNTPESPAIPPANITSTVLAGRARSLTTSRRCSTLIAARCRRVDRRPAPWRQVGGHMLEIDPPSSALASGATLRRQGGRCTRPRRAEPRARHDRPRRPGQALHRAGTATLRSPDSLASCPIVAAIETGLACYSFRSEGYACRQTAPVTRQRSASPPFGKG